MVAQDSPQLQAEGETTTKPTYASFILPQPAEQPLTKIQLKSVDFNHGVPTIKFTLDEIAQYTIEEGLHQALILKFSYGQPDMQQLRKLIPKLLGVKGHCRIGWLARRHILIRFDIYEDYVVAASKTVNYLHCDGEDFLFRVFPWYLGFNPKEETSRAFAWVSLPNLPPELFARSSLLSIASAIGKPIAIDKATQEKSRPSAARVKVEIDLLDKHPNHIRIQYCDIKTGRVMEHIQEFVFDKLPQYCSVCKHQGHEEKDCRLSLVDNGANKQIPTGTQARPIEQYQGDARDILNAKRRDNIASSNQLQQNKAEVVPFGMQQMVTENQCNSVSNGQTSNTNKDGKGGNSQVQNNKSGNPYRTRGADKGKGILVYKEKGNTSIPANKPAGIRICEPKSPSMLMPVVSDVSASVEESAGETETGTIGNTDNGGDQLIAKVAITDPVSNASALNINDAMEMVRKTDDKTGQQLGAGIGNMDVQTNEKGQYTDPKQNVSDVHAIGETDVTDNMAGTDDQTAARKQHKPAGIKIHEHNNPDSIPLVERIQGRNVGISTVEDGLRGTIEVNLTNVTVEGNRAHQNKKADTGTHGTGNLLSAGTDTAEWTTVTRRKARRPPTNSDNETDNAEQLTQAGVEFGIVNSGIAEMAKCPNSVDPAALVDQVDDQLIFSTTDPGRQFTVVLSLADEVVRTMDNQAAENSGRHSFVDGSGIEKGTSSIESMGAKCSVTQQQIHVQSVAKQTESANPHEYTSDAMVTVYQPQQQGNPQCKIDHTKENENSDQQQNRKTMEQDAGITQQSENAEKTILTAHSESQTCDESPNVSVNDRIDISSMKKVVTGGQHQNPSNWAVLVEEEDDNIGILELLYKEESEENMMKKRNERNPNADNKVLSPNAPPFIPNDKQAIQGKHQQQTIEDIDRELLDAVIHANPIEMKNTYPDKLYRQSFRDFDIFNSDDEYYSSDTFYKKSVMKDGIPPRQQRSEKTKNTNKPHVANRKGDDEETVPRQLPMRQAKQKGAGPSNSTRSNKSKKKR